MSDVLPLRSPVADPLADPAGLPLVVDAKRLAELLSRGLRTIRSDAVAGRIPRPLKIGGRVVWRVSEILAWLDAGAPARDVWEARKALSRR